MALILFRRLESPQGFYFYFPEGRLESSLGEVIVPPRGEVRVPQDLFVIIRKSLMSTKPIGEKGENLLL